MDPKKTIVATIPDEVFACSMEGSDRFVYSNYFVPVALDFENAIPILPFYKKQLVTELSRYAVGLGDRTRELVEAVKPGLWGRNALDQAAQDLPRTEYGTFASQQIRRPSLLGKQEKTFLTGLLESDVGFVFLDRTRIRPIGFALGEHVFSLGLAPGEEVVLEQKAFTKRELTYEEQTEQEKQFDVELTSTLSTEIQEGFDKQKTLTDTWGLNLSHTGQYATPANLPWGSINASHTIGYTKNVSEANQETSRRSVKDSRVASAKVSAKYRTQHKTTFKVVSESGFESSSKRTVRNPNRTSPLTLHYFKILQRLQMRQERYGARLCWAPTMKDPAFAFLEKVRKGRQKIVDDALAKLPPRPQEPPVPVAPGAPPPVTEMKTFRSGIIDADDWRLTGDMSADYEADIAFDDGFEWDGSPASVELFTRRTNAAGNLVGQPIVTEDEAGRKLRVTVHIGAASWLGGPPIQFQVSANFSKTVTPARQVIGDAKYADDVAAYRTAIKEWTDKRNEVLAAAQAAGEALEKTLVDGMDPVSEMIAQLIEQDFPAAYRDEAWEIGFWQRVFDWERASFVSYPSWWSTSTPRRLDLDPTHFLNASWARLYLPVRAGMELTALRWIFGKSADAPLFADMEAAFSAVTEDLRKFRKTRIGAPDEVEDLNADCQEIVEQVYCLAHWTEVMPTDGTHVEVMQGATYAADTVTDLEIVDAQKLRAAVIDNEKSSLELRDKAIDQMTQPAELQIAVGPVSRDNT